MGVASFFSEIDIGDLLNDRSQEDSVRMQRAAASRAQEVAVGRARFQAAPTLTRVAPLAPL